MALGQGADIFLLSCLHSCDCMVTLLSRAGVATQSLLAGQSTGGVVQGYNLLPSCGASAWG